MAAAAGADSVSGAVAALSAGSAQERAEAAGTLAREKAADRVPELAARLSKETDKPARQAIAVALANLGAPAFDALKVAAADPLAEVRIEAVVGLGRIGSREAADVLLDRLGKESNEGVKLAVVFWLGELKEVRATEAVGAALKDADPNVRAQSAHTLGRLGSSRARTLLQNAPKDPDGRVQKVIDQNKR